VLGAQCTASAADLGGWSILLQTFFAVAPDPWPRWHVGGAGVQRVRLPRLQFRYSALIASLILGVLWALWHLPFVVTGEDIWVDALLFPIEWSIVYTSLFNNAKGSVLIVMLFHAIDSRPVWWSGPEAGEWSPASSVDRDCASGLVSSLVISVVVKLTFSLRRH
jgi:hypothetical protein